MQISNIDFCSDSGTAKIDSDIGIFHINKQVCPVAKTTIYLYYSQEKHTVNIILEEIILALQAYQLKSEVSRIITALINDLQTRKFVRP